eukprot:131471-Lingulodinium_polyedra.AAC.1
MVWPRTGHVLAAICSGIRHAVATICSWFGRALVVIWSWYGTICKLHITHAFVSFLFPGVICLSDAAR